MAPPKAQDRRSAAILGLVLILVGGLALLLPVQASIAASTGLGALFVVAGVATMIHAAREKGMTSFNLHMLAGAAEVVGGILIWLSPLKGAAAIALLIVIVLAVQGGSHILMSVKLSETSGRAGLFLSGLASLLIAVFLVSRFPYSSVTEPGAMAGVALVAAGIGHVILAAGRRRAAPRPAR